MVFMDALLIRSRPDLSLLLLSLKSNFVLSPIQHLNTGRSRLKFDGAYSEAALCRFPGWMRPHFPGSAAARFVYVIALYDLAYRLNSACYSFVQPFSPCWPL